MFSHSDHHHVRPPVTVPVSLLPTFAAAAPCPERAIVHQQRLESLLESALATAALLHDIDGTATYSDHILEVLGALNRRITASVPATTTPHTSAPATSPSSDGPAPAAIDDDKETKSSHVSYARAVSTVRHSQPTSDIILRLSSAVYEVYPDAILAHPVEIFDALRGAQFPDQGLFAGVRWTRNCNLVIQVQLGTATANFIIEKYASRIWDRIQPVLQYPVGHPAPGFETGDPWHSVVFHHVPALHTRDSYAHSDLQNSLEAGGFHHPVKAFSILCTDEELDRRSRLGLPVALRVTVSSQG
ncbi:hypothetical protein B0H16DRAFT_1737954 [Mycena metata]|uniref:Uncharacterized protein n=1 Tax=Mycena metata TaxID=1033252 RepID=A0AAD7HKF0_9AGAR|nr:hypothetical protein B0H16DRAFT_1737954 [Mycena metata]